MIVDGEPIYTVKDAKVGMFKGIRYPDYPLPSANSIGGQMTAGSVVRWPMRTTRASATCS